VQSDDLLPESVLNDFKYRDNDSANYCEYGQGQIERPSRLPYQPKRDIVKPAAVGAPNCPNAVVLPAIRASHEP